MLRQVAPPAAEELLETRLQRQAESWMALLDAHAQSQRRNLIEARDPFAPSLTPEQRRDAAGAGLINDDTALSAGELRRMCCDAELIPAVLGETSEILDVGRAQWRLP